MSLITRKRVVLYTVVLYFGWMFANSQLHILSASQLIIQQILMPQLSTNLIYINPRSQAHGENENTENQDVVAVPYNQASIANISIGRIPFTVHYERCIHIPKPPKGVSWAEESYINDSPPRSLIDIVNQNRSKVFLVGPSVVRLGEKLKLEIVLYDGQGRRRKGRDLVRVWMKEPSIYAGSVAKVTDNLDGSYSAEFTAFWAGKPDIVVAVVSPREVLATQYKRRLICPAVILFHAVFVNNAVNNTMNNKEKKEKNERTQCSYYPQVPGYTELCNFTQENYGRPWYCGKPRSNRTSCKDWTYLAAKHVFEHEDQLNSMIGLPVYKREYQTMIIPNNISVRILPDKDKVTWTPAEVKCNIVNRSHTWSDYPPTGYLYNKKWTARSCRGSIQGHHLHSCLKDLKMLLIGDSTVRQMYSHLTRYIKCVWETSHINNRNKHGQFKCSNKNISFSLEYDSHELPFRTAMTDHRYFKSINSYLDEYQNINVNHSRVVILIHIFSHFMNYHSHVFYESLLHMKPAIVNLLNANPNSTVIIKGPHAYAFQFDMEKYLRKPEGYLEIYSDYIRRVFKDVKDRVIYLDAADITVATQQGSIHPSKFIVDELINMIFNYICQY